MTEFYHLFGGGERVEPLRDAHTSKSIYGCSLGACYTMCFLVALVQIVYLVCQQLLLMFKTLACFGRAMVPDPLLYTLKKIFNFIYSHPGLS